MRVGAIDQGTTSTRLLVLDQSGNVEVSRVIRHGQHRPAAGWLEHSPEELFQNIKLLIENSGGLDAIGIANQGESCLAWNSRTMTALSPIIVWQDNRTSPIIREMKADGLDAVTIERAGLPLDSYFSASKFSWLLKNNEAVADSLKRGSLRLGTTDSYFLNRLTGQFATDATTASRTSLMNLRTGEWDAELCRLFDVPIHCLPDIRDSVEQFGDVTGIPVTTSIVDQQASLFGHLCRVAGDAKITFGTGAFALVLTDDNIPQVRESGLLPTVAWRIEGKTTYAIDGGVYDACSAVDWAGQIGLFGEWSEITSFERPPAIADGLAFVPALSGLAAPHWDRQAGALWVGMTNASDKSRLCQSVLEGIALLVSEVMEVIDQKMKLSGTVSIDGGLAQNPYFAQFLADILGRRVVTHKFHELTGLGCAYLAAQGIGESPLFTPTAERTFSPQISAETASAWKSHFRDAIARARNWKR